MIYDFTCVGCCVWFMIARPSALGVRNELCMDFLDRQHDSSLTEIWQSKNVLRMAKNLCRCTLQSEQWEEISLRMNCARIYLHVLFAICTQFTEGRITITWMHVSDFFRNWHKPFNWANFMSGKKFIDKLTYGNSLPCFNLEKLCNK